MTRAGTADRPMASATTGGIASRVLRPLADRPSSRGSGASSARVRIALLVAAAVASFVVPAAVASAALTRQQVASFGADGTSGTSFGGPNQLSIDQANRKLYVLDQGANEVHGFGISAPGTQAPLGGAFPFGVADAAGVPDLAADNSASASAGNIYYLAEFSGLYGYDSAGTALGGSFPVTRDTSVDEDPCGAGVDAAGKVWVGDYSTRSVKGFSSTGAPVGAPVDTHAQGSPCHVAFDLNGDMYVAMYFGSVWKYTAASSYTSASEIDSGAANALTVDRATHQVYVAHADHVSVYDAAGASLYSFAADVPGASLSGVAVDQASDRVFVSSPGSGEVLVFGAPVLVAGVATGEATSVALSTATLNGSVDPDGEAVTDCRFEYTDDADFQANGFANATDVACSPDPGSGSGDVAVSADLSGLTAETTYHFRLVATNANGTTRGSELSFTTDDAVGSLTTGTASAVTRTAATLNGSLNPGGTAVADCHFEYTDEADFQVNGFANAANVACSPDPGSSSTDIAVSADLSGLTAQSTYHFRLVATNVSGTTRGDEQPFTTLDAVKGVTTGAATDVGQTTATLGGSLDPDGTAVSDCHFEYIADGFLYWFFGFANATDIPCDPVAGDIGSGSGPVAVAADLSGLTPATTYHVRLVAENSFGTTNGAEQSFLTDLPDLPTATTDATSAGGGPGLTTLEGRVNPNGYAVNGCRFEYGTTTDYGTTTACDQSPASLGAGTTDQPVTASTAPLEPNTTYHYRLRASNITGDDLGDDQAFTTSLARPDNCPNAAIRAAQGIDTVVLPDCMALEQVSPVRKQQQWARGPSVSVDGSRVQFASIATLGDAPSHLSAFGDDYVATRGPSGWQTQSTTPRAQGRGRDITFDSYAVGYSQDFTSWFHVDGDADRRDLGVRRAFEGGLGGVFSPISPLLTPLNGAGGSGGAAFFVGASSDRSHLFLRAGPDGFDVSGSRSVTYLPGDPRPDGVGEDNNVYVAGPGSGGQPALELLARDRDGKVWGSNCGARLGGVRSNEGSDQYLPNGLRDQGAVSPDGSRVYFSTRPNQPETGDCTPAAKMRIMVREETPTGPKIEQLIESECDRVAPACSTEEGEEVFQGASVDQTRVYFTSNRQLVDADVDSSGGLSCSKDWAWQGCDLYVYDTTKPEGGRLTMVSQGDSSAATPGSGASLMNSITSISADGSHVSFVAKSVLTTDANPEGDVAQDGANSLYEYTYPEGDLAFIGALDGADHSRLFGGRPTWSNDAYSVPILGKGALGEEVGGDGHVLLFRSNAALTADDSDDSRDLFRYDANADTLERVSRAGPDGGDNGAFDTFISLRPEQSPTDYAVHGRWVSEDGNDVVFTTEEALVRGDVNGLADAYMWRDGQLFRLPGHTNTSAGPLTPTLSPDGDTVAYATVVPVLPTDGDTVEDVYVARVAGGFPNSPSESACDPLADSCQGDGSRQVDAPNDTAKAGSGNAPAGPRGRLSVKALTSAQRASLARGEAVSLRAKVNQAGRVKARGTVVIARKRVMVLSAVTTAGKAGAVTLKLKLTRVGRRALSRSQKLDVALTIRFSKANKPATTTLKLTKRTTTSKKGGRS